MLRYEYMCLCHVLCSMWGSRKKLPDTQGKNSEVAVGTSGCVKICSKTWIILVTLELADSHCKKHTQLSLSEDSFEFSPNQEAIFIREHFIDCVQFPQGATSTQVWFGSGLRMAEREMWVLAFGVVFSGLVVLKYAGASGTVGYYSEFTQNLQQSPLSPGYYIHIYNKQCTVLS